MTEKEIEEMTEEEKAQARFESTGEGISVGQMSPEEWQQFLAEIGANVNSTNK